MEPIELMELHRVYHEAIENAEKDPYHYGFRLPHWEKAEEQLKEVNEILALGGNRSGKTSWGSYCVVKAAVENPGAEIFCFAQTSEVSIRQQQSAVWGWLPAELRMKQTSSNAYISYTKKNGFTDNSLILPNGSQIIFKTYSQYQNNSTILEGAELGSRDPKWHNIGVWVDEYLLGPELINTLRFRLATRDAKMLVTFTPIDGWTEVIKEYLDGASTLESKEAELLKGDVVPYVQRSKRHNASIHYFHSQDNPFGGYDRIKQTLINKPREEILIRAYGVPVKSHATKFPKFNKVVNVVSPDKVPKHNVTRYHIIDPAGAKNWFMAWIAVDETGTFWVYREWPGVDVGDWAEWKGGKWVPGDGAKGQGFGIKDYVDLINQTEEGETIFERLIDPRLGAARYQAQDGSSSIIADLNDAGVVCLPAPGLEIDDGLQALIGKMAWDTTKPMDSVNRPHFYVSSDCENIIQALSEYTGDGGLKEAWKDCYCVDTEVLTEDGWFKFKDLEKGSKVATMSPDGFLEYQVPTDYIERYYDGVMYQAESKSINFKVTPTHRMLVYPQKNELTFRLAKDLCRQDTFPICTEGLRDRDTGYIELWNGKFVAEEDWAEFIGWFVSEGSSTGSRGGKIQIPGRGYSVYISQCRDANPDKCDRIAKLLDRMGLKHSYRGRSFVVSSKNLWEILHPLGHSGQKRIPRSAINLPKRALEKMWEALVLGDGWVDKGSGCNRYATSSPLLVDDIQELMQKLGKPSNSTYTRDIGYEGGFIKGRKIIGTTPLYMLGERKGRKATITTKDKQMLLKQVHYTGNVYCATVPNGTLIVRRNGKPLVCGNCVDVLRYAAVAGIDHVDTNRLYATTRGHGGY